MSKNAYKYVADLETSLGEIPLVKVHHGNIGQVILNLIINAANAIESVKSSTGEMGRIYIETKRDGENVRITISDTGGGIDNSIRDRIFDPFFTTKEVGKGSGQGLAISRTIVHEKHGGEIHFESENGVGTTFFISLPIEG